MTLNKYHSSGRLYITKELSARRHALTPTYLVSGYSHDPLAAQQQRLTGDCLPYHVGKNAHKRRVRWLGFKSAKQYAKHQFH